MNQYGSIDVMSILGQNPELSHPEKHRSCTAAKRAKWMTASRIGLVAFMIFLVHAISAVALSPTSICAKRLQNNMASSSLPIW